MATKYKFLEARFNTYTKFVAVRNLRTGITLNYSVPWYTENNKSVPFEEIKIEALAVHITTLHPRM